MRIQDFFLYLVYDLDLSQNISLILFARRHPIKKNHEEPLITFRVISGATVSEW